MHLPAVRRVDYLRTGGSSRSYIRTSSTFERLSGEGWAGCFRVPLLTIEGLGIHPTPFRR